MYFYSINSTQTINLYSNPVNWTEYQLNYTNRPEKIKFLGSYDINEEGLFTLPISSLNQIIVEDVDPVFKDSKVFYLSLCVEINSSEIGDNGTVAYSKEGALSDVQIPTLHFSGTLLYIYDQWDPWIFLGFAFLIIICFNLKNIRKIIKEEKKTPILI